MEIFGEKKIWKIWEKKNCGQNQKKNLKKSSYIKKIKKFKKFKKIGKNQKRPTVHVCNITWVGWDYIYMQGWYI